jgi:hypothetical protein
MSCDAQYKAGDFSLDQAHQFFEVFVCQGGTPELLRKGVEDTNLMSEFVKMLKAKHREPFYVTIDYGRTLEEMIASGKYYWRDSDINVKNFPIEHVGKVDVNIELVNFDCIMESDDVLRELDKMGFRSATLPELLAFSTAHSETQRGFPIVALGTVWRDLCGNHNVVCSYSDFHVRRLFLRWSDIYWDTLFRFAAVRK